MMDLLEPPDRGEEPDRCSQVRIAAEAGVLLAVALDVIGSCWCKGGLSNYWVLCKNSDFSIHSDIRQQTRDSNQ